MNDAHRQQPVLMTCVCRLRAGGGHDSCTALTSGPDEPVCTYCAAALHPQHSEFDPIVKRPGVTRV